MFWGAEPVGRNYLLSPTRIMLPTLLQSPIFPLMESQEEKGCFAHHPILIFLFHGRKASTNISLSLSHPSYLKVRRKNSEAVAKQK